MRYFAFFIMSQFIFCSLYAEDNDSISPGMLDEVVVVGDRGWIENGVINVIPSKSEKKLSNSPASLIKSMHLPFLKEKDDAIVDMSGETVPVFINGERADNIDLATFWPNEVKRVQYTENPSDPGYEGVKAAVNFVMPKYEVGGVSRVQLFQRVPNNGFCNAASKLTYKKMTYGAMFRGSYERDHRTYMTGETQYKDLFYEEDKYDVITREEDNNSYGRQDGIECALNAKYSTENTTITHTVSLAWKRNPGSGSNSSNDWSENLFDSSAASDYSESTNISPQMSGVYILKLSDKWHLSGKWIYSYARNKNYSFNKMGESEPIYNSSFEDVNSCKFVVLPSFVQSKNLFFQLRTECTLDWYSTLYTGSANTRQTQSRQELSSSFLVNWRPVQSIYLTLQPGVLASLWQIGDINQHTVNPTASAFVRWDPTRKYTLSGKLSFYMSPTTASESNPVLVKTSELLWTIGNPYLKSLTSWSAYIYSAYLPKNWLTAAFGFRYGKAYNSVVSTYVPASQASGGLIKEIINAEPEDNLMASMSLQGSFFNNSLSIGISPTWHYNYMRGEYQDSFSFFTLSGSADYTIGNVRFGLWYEGPYKDLSAAGMEKFWKQDKWNASITYGTNNLHLDFRVEDIFHDKQKSWIRYNSPYYCSKYDYYKTGRSFSISLTYSFGYGKKVDNGIDISGPESVKTSVL